jgi:hypothetical protein
MLAQKLVTWSVCAALLACPKLAEATLVLVVQTPKGIILAADSRRLRMKVDGTTIFNRTCKVYDKDSYAFALVGVPFESITGFDAAQIVSKKFTPRAPLAKSVVDLGQALRNELTAALTWLAQNRPTEFRYYEALGRLQVVLVGSGGKRPEAWLIQIYPTTDRLTLDVKSERIVTEFKTFGVDYAVTERSRVSGKATLPGAAYDTKTNLARILNLVEAQSEGGELAVAPPVDAVMLTSSGTQWLTERGDCSASLELLERERSLR